MAWGSGGVGAITFMLLAISSDATLWLRDGLGFGWGGGNNVHVTCDLKWCYARTMSWLGVWVGWGQ